MVMKCRSCKKTFETGKYCSDCGDVLEEVEQLRVESKRETTKNKKEKKKIKAGKIVGFIVLLCIALFIGFSSIYLNTSRIKGRVDIEKNFDPEAYIDYLRLENFDGLRMNDELEADQVNMILKEHFTFDHSLPFNLKISNVYYKNGEFYADIDNTFIHSTVIADVSLDFENDMLTPVVHALKIGEWRLPLPIKGILKSKGLLDPIEMPVYLSHLDLELKSKKIAFDVSLDESYFFDLFKDGFDSMDEEIIDVLVFADNRNAYRLYLTNDLIYDEDVDMLKSYLYDTLNTEGYIATYLYAMENDKATELLNKVLTDTKLLNEKAKQAVIDDVASYTNEYNGIFENAKDEMIIENLLLKAKSIYNYLDFYLDDDDDVIAYNSKPYSLSKGCIVTIQALEDYYTGKVIKDEKNYELFYENGFFHLATNDRDQWYLIRDDFVYMRFDTKEEMMNYYGFDSKVTLKSAELLHRGNDDRKAIADMLSDYLSSDNSIFINYLKSDSEWAYIVAAPGDYSHRLNQYVLKKEGDVWRIVHEFGKTIDIMSYIEELIGLGMNPSILPSYNMCDYQIWKYDQYDMDGITNHLIENGYLTTGAQISYFNRVDEVCALSYKNGERFIFVFDDYNQYQYDFLYVLEEDETFLDYMYVLKSEYKSVYPTFVFLQD